MKRRVLYNEFVSLRTDYVEENSWYMKRLWTEEEPFFLYTKTSLIGYYCSLF
jgi:hypothetical protein